MTPGRGLVRCSLHIMFCVVVLITFRLVAPQDRSSPSGAGGPGSFREITDGS